MRICIASKYRTYTSEGLSDIYASFVLLGLKVVTNEKGEAVEEVMLVGEVVLDVFLSF